MFIIKMVMISCCTTVRQWNGQTKSINRQQMVCKHYKNLIHLATRHPLPNIRSEHRQDYLFCIFKPFYWQSNKKFKTQIPDCPLEYCRKGQTLINLIHLATRHPLPNIRSEHRHSRMVTNYVMLPLSSMEFGTITCTYLYLHSSDSLFYIGFK
jgi:hypothetical protein